MQQTDPNGGGREVRGTREMWGALGRAALAVTVLAGCALFRSAVNDSPALRWWLFSRYGVERMCPEMQSHTAPLRLTPGGNVTGRLFPTSCQVQVDESRRVVSLDFTGNGYAWTP